MVVSGHKKASFVEDYDACSAGISMLSEGNVCFEYRRILFHFTARNVHIMNWQIQDRMIAAVVSIRHRAYCHDHFLPFLSLGVRRNFPQMTPE